MSNRTFPGIVNSLENRTIQSDRHFVCDSAWSNARRSISRLRSRLKRRNRNPGKWRGAMKFIVFILFLQAMVGCLLAQGDASPFEGLEEAIAMVQVESASSP